MVMFRNLSAIPAILLLMLSIFSCERVEMAEKQTGYLYFNLQQDFSEEVVFKSEAAEDVVFAVTIYDSEGQVVAAYDDHRQIEGAPLELHVGTYRLAASSAPVGAAAFDAPFYYGDKEILIKSSTMSTVTLTASLANVKVTASFSEEITNQFAEYILTVTNGEGSLVYSNLDGTINKEGYFAATGTLTWTLALKNIEGEEYQLITETYTDVKPRQHYTLRFDLQEEVEFGGTGMVVRLDDSTKDKAYNLLLDFEANVRPTVSASFDMNQVFTYSEGEAVEAIFKINVPGGFRSAVISHSIIELSSNSLPYNFPIMGMTINDRTYYANKGILIPEIKTGDTFAQLNLSGLFAKLPIGKYQIKFFIDSENGKNRTQFCNFEVVPSVEVEAVSAAPWAQFAILSAKWYPDVCPEGLSFQYRKQTASEWTDVDPSIVLTDDASKTFTAEVWGLEPSTSYVFRAISALDSNTKEKSFTTETAGTIPNMGFDSWYQSGKIWYPNSDSGNFWWDTANGGSDAVGVYPTSPEYSHKKGGSAAAKLESKSVALVGLAAGNIYTGKFVKAITSLTDPGAELDWGVQFASRPLALKGYVDYAPGTVNKTNAPYNSMSGKLDIATVQVFITDWSSPFRISTASGKFVDTESDPGIIAYGSMDFNATNGYVEFTVPLTYRSTTRQPRYIVIAAAASKYGDYFTGSTSSVMYVDEFSFVYDPSELTEDQLAKVQYK